MAASLVTDLRERGYTTFTPAPKPPDSEEFSWDVVANCRVLIKYIPASALSECAGRYAMRVDVMAER